MNDAGVEMDLNRVISLARHMVNRLEEEMGDVEWRLDDFAISVVVVYKDEDGDEREEVSSFFTTSRRYVQAGIIAAAWKKAKEYL